MLHRAPDSVSEVEHLFSQVTRLWPSGAALLVGDCPFCTVGAGRLVIDTYADTFRTFCCAAYGGPEEARQRIECLTTTESEN
ncbi:MAG: hypothetical protein MI920_17310 [Kiloniellales bacterium]|nr:hypothetical protein [Kiloniellales bacterium]